MEKRELILICGISGAGKTVTMDYFDSAGFYCIDNLPVKAVVSTIKALQTEDSFLKYAIALNSNATEDIISLTLTKLKTLEWLDFKILFLDVSNEVLYKRFQMTRKQHPFTNMNETLYDAINQERELLRALRQHASLIIDTTDLTADKLKKNLSRIFNHEILPSFRLCFVSFGYKHGLPQNLDYAFDVRFIDNPYYYENLKELSGNDSEVYDFVMQQPITKDFLEKLTSLLDLCIAEQKKTSRGYLVVGIGCTGGQHRSVSICNYLTDHYEDKYNTIKDHRDVKYKKM